MTWLVAAVAVVWVGATIGNWAAQRRIRYWEHRRDDGYAHMTELDAETALLEAATTIIEERSLTEDEFVRLREIVNLRRGSSSD